MMKSLEVFGGDRGNRTPDLLNGIQKVGGSIPPVSTKDLSGVQDFSTLTKKSICVISTKIPENFDIVKPIELGDTNFVSYLRKQVSRFPPTRE